LVVMIDLTESTCELATNNFNVNTANIKNFLIIQVSINEFIWLALTDCGMRSWRITEQILIKVHQM
jgi:hypothetical protein